MEQYHDLLRHILKNGVYSNNRTGISTLSVFGYQMRFDLSKGFPAVTTKKLAWKSVVSELLWFLEGSTDERRLAELHYGKDRSELAGRTTIWTANADAQGKDLGYTNNDFVKELGPIYGSQWRNWRTDRIGKDNGRYSCDQIVELIREIRTAPNSRRLILSAWNVGEISRMSLPPCHVLAQFRVNNGKLSCMMFQRSADVFLGTPFNIASYALLTHILARETKLEVGDLVYSIGDAHIYVNHLDQVNQQLTREPYSLPTLEIADDFNLDVGLIEGFKLNEVENFVLKDYYHDAAITAPMAV